VGKREGSNHLEDLDVDGRIILKRCFKQWDGLGRGLRCSRSEWGHVECSCECGNDYVGSIYCSKFIDYSCP
jgi:hypothetical protein